MWFGVIAEVLEMKSPQIQVSDMVMDYHRGIWSELIILRHGRDYIPMKATASL